jgi:hypothetical protein
MVKIDIDRAALLPQLVRDLLGEPNFRAKHSAFRNRRSPS